MATEKKTSVPMTPAQQVVWNGLMAAVAEPYSALARQIAAELAVKDGAQAKAGAARVSLWTLCKQAVAIAANLTDEAGEATPQDAATMRAGFETACTLAKVPPGTIKSYAITVEHVREDTLREPTILVDVATDEGDEVQEQDNPAFLTLEQVQDEAFTIKAARERYASQEQTAQQAAMVKLQDSVKVNKDGNKRASLLSASHITLVAAFGELVKSWTDAEIALQLEVIKDGEAAKQSSEAQPAAAANG